MTSGHRHSERPSEIIGSLDLWAVLESNLRNKDIRPVVPPFVMVLAVGGERTKDI